MTEHKSELLLSFQPKPPHVPCNHDRFEFQVVATEDNRYYNSGHVWHTWVDETHMPVSSAWKPVARRCIECWGERSSLT